MEKKTKRRRSTLPGPVKKLFWAGRLAIGAAAFVPLFLFMVLFNFKVDCQGYFQGDQELRDVVELMLNGHDVVGAERLNNSQRKIIKTFVHNMENVPATIALGSSRVMMISSEMLGTDSFYNCAITGADMYDLMGTYYLFEQRGAVPQNIIIGVDPWVFGGEDAVDPRSDKALYAEFLLRDLGIETDFETEDPTMKWEALYSPSYFQGNLTYFLSAQGEVVKPQAVEGDVMAQDTEVMRSDGSIVYSRSFRTQPQESVDAAALEQTGNFFRMEYYEEPEEERIELFTKFVQYLQEKGIRVVFLLSPYHPIAYDNAMENAGHYSGFVATEPLIRRIAKQLDVPVYGSYNPYAMGLTNADFYDGIHVRSEALSSFFPPLEDILYNLENDIDVSVNYRKKAPLQEDAPKGAQLA